MFSWPEFKEDVEWIVIFLYDVVSPPMALYSYNLQLHAHGGVINVLRMPGVDCALYLHSGWSIHPSEHNRHGQISGSHHLYPCLHGS